MRAYDRYILRELIGLFSACFGFFLVVFVAIDSLSGQTRAVMDLGILPWLQHLCFRAISFQSFVTPMAVLLSSLICHNKMATDGDLLGLRVSGLGLSRISRPALIFFALIALGGFLVGEFLGAPAERADLRLILETNQHESVNVRALTGSLEVLSDGRERILTAHSLDIKQRQINGLFLNFFYEGRRQEEVYAAQATWNGVLWTLKEVRWIRFDGYEERGQETTFATIESATPLVGPLPTPDELLLEDPLQESVRSLRAKLASIPQDAAFDPQRRKLIFKLHRGLALNVCSLIFGLLSLSFAFAARQRGIGASMGATVVIALCYYLISSIAASAALTGSVSPVAAAWFANLLFGAVALGLLARLFSR